MQKMKYLFRFVAILLMLTACIPAVTPEVIVPTSTPIIVQSTVPVAPATEIPSSTMTPGGIPAHLQQIHFISPLEGWAIGVDGTTSRLLKTVDGGRTWTDGSAKEIISEQEELVQTLIAAFQGSEDIWLVQSTWPGMPNFDAKVIFSSDGGVSWSESALFDQTDQFESFSVSHLLFLDDQTGWLMAHVGAGMNHDYIVLYQTTDGGFTWEKLISPFEDSSGIQACQKNGLWFADPSHGWLTGSCNGVAAGVLLFRTEDGGRHWQPIQLPVLDGFADLFGMGSGYCGSNPIRQGSGSIVEVEVACHQVTPVEDTIFFTAKTQDNGMSWTIQPVETTKQYTYTIGGQHMVDLGTIWRWSADGGASWKDAFVQSPWPGYGLALETPDEEHWFALTWSEAGTNLATSEDQGNSWDLLNPIQLNH